jgi:hypothetical protein
MLPCTCRRQVQEHELFGMVVPDPGSARLRDSRRSTCHPEVFHAYSRTIAASHGPTPRGCPPVTPLAANVPPGVVGTRELACTNSGGSRPSRVQ